MDIASIRSASGSKKILQSQFSQFFEGNIRHKLTFDMEKSITLEQPDIEEISSREQTSDETDPLEQFVRSPILSRISKGKTTGKRLHVVI